MYKLLEKIINELPNDDKIKNKLSCKKKLIDETIKKEAEIEKKKKNVNNFIDDYMKKIDKTYISLYKITIQTLVDKYTTLYCNDIDVAINICAEIEKKMKEDKKENNIILEKKKRETYVKDLSEKEEYKKYKYYVTNSNNYSKFINLNIDYDEFTNNINKYVENEQKKEKRKTEIDNLIIEKIVKSKHSFAKSNDIYANFIEKDDLNNINKVMENIENLVNEKKAKESKKRKIDNAIKKINLVEDIENIDDVLKNNEVYEQYINEDITFDDAIKHFSKLVDKYKIREKRKNKIKKIIQKFNFKDKLLESKFSIAYINNKDESLEKTTEYLTKYHQFLNITCKFETKIDTNKYFMNFIYGNLSEDELKFILYKKNMETANPAGSRVLPKQFKHDICERLLDFKCKNDNIFNINGIYVDYAFFIKGKCESLNLKCKQTKKDNLYNFEICK